jgi:hypothetical protein
VTIAPLPTTGVLGFIHAHLGDNIRGLVLRGASRSVVAETEGLLAPAAEAKFLTLATPWNFTRENAMFGWEEYCKIQGMPFVMLRTRPAWSLVYLRMQEGHYVGPSLHGQLLEVVRGPLVLTKKGMVREKGVENLKVRHQDAPFLARLLYDLAAEGGTPVPSTT